MDSLVRIEPFQWVMRIKSRKSNCPGGLVKGAKAWMRVVGFAERIARMLCSCFLAVAMADLSAAKA